MKKRGQELHIKFGLALLDLGIRNGQGKVVGVASLGMALQKVVGEESHTGDVCKGASFRLEVEGPSPGRGSRKAIDEAKIGEPSIMSACPVCGLTFNTLMLEHHVNSCLDRSTQINVNVQKVELEKTVKQLDPFRSKLASRGLLSKKPNAPSNASEIHPLSSGKLSELYKSVATPRGFHIPHHKVLIGTRFVVDAFKWGPLEDCPGYFLSHFHSDHYDGLNSSWAAKAPIFCSSTTAKLVMLRLQVKPGLIQILPMDTWTELPGIRVILIDANHCPGSVMFIFDIGGNYVLHTGDCRANPGLVANVQSRVSKTFKAIYLDTTYCGPQHTFPCQNACIKECTRFVKTVVEDRTQVRFSPIRRLVLVGGYVIGKERIALAIAEQIGSKIYVPGWKRAVLMTFEWSELIERLTDDPHEAMVHMVPMGSFNKDALSEYLDPFYPKHATHILAIRPTGWTGLKTSTTTHDYRSSNRVRKEALTVHSVPYSEHSSFTELAGLLAGCPTELVIPTVSNDGLDMYIRPGSTSPVDTLLHWHSLYSRR